MNRVAELNVQIVVVLAHFNVLQPLLERAKAHLASGLLYMFRHRVLLLVAELMHRVPSVQPIRTSLTAQTRRVSA